MACFVVPATEAIVTTVIQKVVAKKEKNENKDGSQMKIGFADKLKWLNGMLWGGSGLLAFEHVWHGEVVPWFPFLTAAANPEDAAEMLHEMATVGVSMAALVTLVWLAMLGVSAAIEKRALREEPVKA